MTTIGLKVSVLVALGVEIGTQVVVVLDEEVGLANANPEEVGVLGEEPVNLCVAVGIDFGMTALVVLLLVDSGREQSYVAESGLLIEMKRLWKPPIESPAMARWALSFFTR